MSFPDIDPKILYVNATIQNQTPLVYWAYAGTDGTLTITAARERARYLLAAAAIAESEAAIVRGIGTVPQRGFGKPSRREQLDAQLVAAQTLQLIRKFRPPLPPEIEVIFGHKTQLPLIVLGADLYGGAMQLEVAQVESHAMDLLGAAEAAESDAFLYHFQAELGLSQAEANVLVQEFGLFRRRNRLEDLFREELK